MQTEYGRQYARLYRDHWWWRAREEVVVRTLRRLALPGTAEVLDVGCGDAVSFPVLEGFGRVRGIEVDEGLLDPEGRYRGRISTLRLGDPFYDDESWRFDLITGLDVVEHIEDDRAAMASLVRMLRPGGFLVLTVPAFGVLWDHHDDLNQHYRRYRARELRGKLGEQGLEVVELRYLFASLFFPKLGVRLLNQFRRAKVEQHGIPPAVLNAGLKRAMLVEERLSRYVRLPLGTSLLAVARKGS